MTITRPVASPGRLVALLGVLSALPALAIDLYLPALPTMSGDLGTTPGLLQLTVTVFVLGLAVGQVVVGPLSDAWGRRPLLVTGMVAFVAGSLGCLAAPGVDWLLGARAVQALGAAAVTVLARAVVRDHFEGDEMTRFYSTLMLVNGVATVLGPIVGGQLLLVASWRSCFAVLAVGGTLLLVVVLARLPESLPPQRRRPARPRAVAAAFAEVARDRGYRAYALAGALMFAAMFAYISGSPFVLQTLHGLSAQQYSVVFAVNASGIALLGHVNALLVGRAATAERLLGLSLAGGAVAGLGVLAAVVLALPLPVLLVALFAVVGLLGPVLANATSLALAAHPGAAGTAASLLGVVQYAATGAVVLAMGLVGHDAAASGTGMAVAVATCTAGAAGAYALLRPAGRDQVTRKWDAVAPVRQT
ncbi:multidrug effflux MFS transporter [Nocardioides zeae]|uniref:Multidrug effflux MFS transporter n=1 Tax=Nocardioides imazamoxiresistens TaxID=3231893 RepID=A0ABU3PS98_9ACTN|nr:multidrug effflux MFS transporter [Nocardioides zeae]MDT9592105.1 multidrug effflux MFS transporter [Nocardioides zeae]